MEENLSRQQKNILYALKGGPKNSAELNDICFQANARMWELKRKGYVINRHYLEKGLHLYTLISEPTETGQSRLAV